MALNINVLNSCKMIAIRAKSYTGVTSGTLEITDLVNTGTTTHTINYSGTNLAGYIQLQTTQLISKYGVFEVCLYESGVKQACKPLIIHCDIDCCLVKLTNEIIDCACDCPRCSTALAKAQKVFLLLQAANSSKELANTATGSTNEGYYQDIKNKYIKAKEICDDSCGCDC